VKRMPPGSVVLGVLAVSVLLAMPSCGDDPAPGNAGTAGAAGAPAAAPRVLFSIELAL